MTVIARPEAGTFCPPTLVTNEAAAAKKFFATLLGWSYQDREVAPGKTFTRALVGGRHAAAIAPQPPGLEGAPARFLSHIASDDAAATAAAATRFGGKVEMAPADAMGMGRIAMIRDPIGAEVGVWETHEVVESVSGEPGSLAWTQLNASDPGAAAAFYEGVFGWSHRKDPMPWGGDYVTFLAGEATRGGGMPMPPGANAPAHWLPYFAVTDVDAAVETASQHGGKTFVPAMDIPGTGRFAVLGEPGGAIFAVVKFQKS